MNEGHPRSLLSSYHGKPPPDPTSSWPSVPQCVGKGRRTTKGLQTHIRALEGLCALRAQITAWGLMTPDWARTCQAGFPLFSRWCLKVERPPFWNRSQVHPWSSPGLQSDSRDLTPCRSLVVGNTTAECRPLCQRKRYIILAGNANSFKKTKQQKHKMCFFDMVTATSVLVLARSSKRVRCLDLNEMNGCTVWGEVLRWTEMNLRGIVKRSLVIKMQVRFDTTLASLQLFNESDDLWLLSPFFMIF